MLSELFPKLDDNSSKALIMRIAIVSDIHGNLTALDAVMTDLRQQKPDVIFHGGDIPYGGCNPAEVIDWIAQEGW